MWRAPEIAAGPTWLEFATSIADLWHVFLDHVPRLATAAVVVVSTAILARGTRAVLRRVLTRTRLRASLRELFSQLAHAAVWVPCVPTAAVVVFPEVGFFRVLAAVALASIALGLAFKDILEDVFAGVLILWRFPFETGDYIMVEGNERLQGEVEDTWIRMTLLRTVTDELVVVPNATLYKSAVRVLTWRDRRRQEIAVTVPYEEDVDGARRLIARAVAACTSVDGRHEVQVFARSFTDVGLELEVAWWSGATPLELRASRDEVVAAIKRAFDRAGLKVPFPHRTPALEAGHSPRLGGDVGLRVDAASGATR